MTTYREEDFIFSKQGLQIYVQDGQSFVPLQRSDLNQSTTSATSSAALTTAFGESSVAKNQPFIQSAPVGSFLPANFRAYTFVGGEAGV